MLAAGIFGAVTARAASYEAVGGLLMASLACLATSAGSCGAAWARAEDSISAGLDGFHHASWEVDLHPINPETHTAMSPVVTNVLVLPSFFVMTSMPCLPKDPS